MSGYDPEGPDPSQHQPSEDTLEEDTQTIVLEGFHEKVHPTGDVYTGHFVAGEMHGKGLMTYAHTASGGANALVSFDGDFEHNVPVRGTATYADGSVYTGELKIGRKTGPGTLVDSHGVEYKGTFVDDEIKGLVTITYPDDSVYSGTFKTLTYHYYYILFYYPSCLLMYILLHTSPMSLS